MVLAGDKLLVGFAADTSSAERSVVLRMHGTRDGEQLSEVPLDSGVIQSGMAVAGGRVYLSCEDGTLRCFGE